MDHEDLVTTFGQSVGVEKAEALVAGALQRLDIEKQDSYTSHEIADICETIGRSRDGYVRVVANEVWIREQAQRRFDALLAEISDPVVTVSFEGAEPIVEAVNPAFESIFGYGDEAVGRSLTDLIVPEDDPPESVDRWMRSDGASSTEVDRYTADGTRRTFLFRSVVVSGFDADVEGFGIYTDISERKRRERTLELKNEQLERFASVVSHDLRNPLAVARGHMGLAREAASDPTVLERLDTVANALDEMDELIEDLLDLASQGRTVDDPQPTSLRDVVCDAWRNVDTADVSVSLWGPPDLTVTADEARLRQLLENLFRNAVEHGSTDARDGAQSEDVTGGGPNHAIEGANSDAIEGANSDATEDASSDATGGGTPADIVEQSAVPTGDLGSSPQDAADASRPDAAATAPRREDDASDPQIECDADASDTRLESDGNGASAARSVSETAPRGGEAEPLQRLAVLESDVEQSGWGVPATDDVQVNVRIEWAAGVLSVEDDGPGIPPEERAEVLEYGYTTSEDGTGFGLAIVQAIAEAHSWSVTVSEGRDGGARFEFEGVSRAD